MFVVLSVEAWFYILLTVHLVTKFLLITNLTHFFTYLFISSLCMFERHSAHHQEIELY